MQAGGGNDRDAALAKRRAGHERRRFETVGILGKEMLGFV
jgi:hypothetical protein